MTRTPTRQEQLERRSEQPAPSDEVTSCSADREPALHREADSHAAWGRIDEAWTGTVVQEERAMAKWAHWLTSALLLTVIMTAGCARSTGVAGWIEDEAVPVSDLCGSTPSARRICRSFDDARVVGLGEATHGQHESFEIKRALTMHLIKHHGYRIVAYEASASRALACDAYVSGASDDVDAAMRGFGMMIWDIEENAALLRALRAWNQEATPEQRVRFIGIDVQDAAACTKRLAALLDERWPQEAAEVRRIGGSVDGAIQKMMGGDRSSYDELVREHLRLNERLQNTITQGGLAERELKELRAVLREFEGVVQMALTNGRRDRAMAELLLAELEDSGPNAKAVLWAHNEHVTKSPMRFMASDELATGGHLAAALGQQYYAIGFAFGSGDFVANDVVEGTWIYRTYGVDEPPIGSLEFPFAEVVRTASLIDLRSESGDDEVEAWKLAGHGQRWAGGYRVPEDIREISRDADRLLPTYPRQSFDALLFLPRTTPSTPRS
jgi:erythromycin esterase